MIRRVRTFAQSAVRERSWPLLVDCVVFAGVLAIFYALSVVTRYWFAAPVAQAEVLRSPRALPVYAFYSLVRMATAYLLSLVFALAYGYIAAYNKRVEALMIAVLDVLQSIDDGTARFQPGERADLVARHQPALASNVGGEDRGEFALYRVDRHAWLLSIQV